MPKKLTPKARRTMQAAEHNPKFAKKIGIKPSVAREILHGKGKGRKKK